jgi:hypothetical protein
MHTAALFESLFARISVKNQLFKEKVPFESPHIPALCVDTTHTHTKHAAHLRLRRRHQRPDENYFGGIHRVFRELFHHRHAGTSSSSSSRSPTGNGHLWGTKD